MTAPICTCCTPTRYPGDVCTRAIIVASQYEVERNQPTARVFSNLTGAPRDEEQHFSGVARAMRSSAGWRAVPRYAAPAPVAGELRAKTERGKRALYALNRLDAEDIALAIEIMDERTKARCMRALRGAP